MNQPILNQTILNNSQLNKAIYNFLFSTQTQQWKTVQEILDLHIPQLMTAAASAPAYQFLFAEQGIDPTDITTFEQFDTTIPVITPDLYYRIINSTHKGKRIGVEGFMPTSSAPRYVYHTNDKHIQHKLVKGSERFTTVCTSQDMEANAIGLAACLKRQFGSKNIRFVDDQQQGSYITDLLTQAAHYYASVQTTSDDGETEQLQSFGNPQDYWGIFPTHINTKVTTIPHLVYPVCRQGKRTRDHGTFVITNLFSAHSNPFGSYGLLKQATEALLAQPEFIPTPSTSSNGKWYAPVLEQLNGGPLTSKSELIGVYKNIVHQWLLHDVVWQPPQGTIFLKFAVPIVGSIADDGTILHSEHVPKTSTIDKGSVYIYRHGKHDVQHQPPFLKNIINDQPRDSPINVRVFDVTEGRHEQRYPQGRKYLYSQPSVLKQDVASTFAAIERQKNKSITVHPTLHDIRTILLALHQKVASDSTLHRLYVEKSGIPLAETYALIQQAKEFITIDNLQKIVSRSLQKPHHRPNESEIRAHTPLYPFYVVTAGNMNFQDWFVVLAELLLATLTARPVSYIIRPSESDLVSSYCLYHYDRVVREHIDDAQPKGLTGIFHRLFWNPNIHPEYGLDMLTFAQGSISFGTLQSFEGTRSKAALIQYQKQLKQTGKQGELEKLQSQQPLTPTKIDQGSFSEETKQFFTSFFDRHILYQETINAAIVLRDSSVDQEESIAQDVLHKAYKLRGTDCLSLQNVFVPLLHEHAFTNLIRQKASKLRFGNINDLSADLAWYSPQELEELKSSLKKLPHEKVEIISPECLPTHEHNGISPKKGMTGVVLLRSSAADLEHTEGFVAEWVAKHQGVPLIHLITYSDYDVLVEKIEVIRQLFEKSTQYPRFTYLALFGGSDKELMRSRLGYKTDLLLENSLTFDPVQPHNRRYFLRDILGLGALPP